jgi:hypothetical protein
LSKYVQSQSDLLRHFRAQLRFMQKSCDAFDDGDEDEAARLATALRLLLDERRSQRSLMGQIGLLDTTPFISSVLEHDPKNLVPNSGLILLAKIDDKWKYEPILDSLERHRALRFNDWWNETVFSDLNKNEFTRKELVRSMADQDGGAHVDPTLGEKYACLSRQGALGHSNKMGEVSCQIRTPVGVSRALDHSNVAVEEGAQMLRPELAGMRQIAHEVLKSLVPGYKKLGKSGGARVQLVGFFLPES